MNKELIENISLRKNKKRGCLEWKHCLSNTYCSEVLKDLCVTAPYLYKAVSYGFKQLHGLAVVSLVILQQSLTHGQPHTLSYLELMVFCWVSEGEKQRHLTNAIMDISVIIYSFLCHSIYNKYDFFFGDCQPLSSLCFTKEGKQQCEHYSKHLILCSIK